MLANFKKHIELKFPFLKESKLLVTVSGGIDSVVLLHLLYQLDYSIVITHCNFCLREKESDIDEVFVKNLASKLEVPFFTKRFSTEKYASNHKLSIQEAARNLRYQWFSTLAKEQKCHAILTAHNLNDNLETFLINFSRGTGLKGLIGIPQINKNINRPLMAFSRKEITAFANENNIEWREDKSNANTKYTRNKIRHSIIPVLEELNPNLLVSFKQTLENLQGSQQIVESQILDFKQQIEVENPSVSLNSEENTKKFNVKKFKNLKNPKAYIHAIFAPYNFTNFNDIVGLLSAQSGKQLFSKTHRLLKDRDVLLLESRSKTKDARQFITINETDTLVTIQHSTFNIKHSAVKIQQSISIKFDKNLLKFPLIVRKWQKGDYFYPIGMEGKKKLSKYFKDEKISLIEKENIWLLLSDNEIVWIIGKRQDERFKITSRTTQILEFYKTEHNE